LDDPAHPRRPSLATGRRSSWSRVDVEEHAGTLQDPYIASGMVFDQCYVFAR
jgi:hypothetical protein